MRATVAAISAVLILLTAACQASPKSGKPAHALAQCSSSPFPQQSADPELVQAAPTAGRRHGATTLTIVTNLGDIEIEVDRAKTPCTLAFLEYLADKRFYQGSACHRLTTEGLFVLQCGDPDETGMGGPGFVYGEENLPWMTASPDPSPSPTCVPFAWPSMWADGTAIEVRPSSACMMMPEQQEVPTMTYPRGTVAVATMSWPSSSGSQFFFVYRDSTISASYTPFGTVTRGFDLIEQVAAGGTRNGTSDGFPQNRLEIQSVTLR